MSKSIKCPLCHSDVEQRSTTYNSGETDLLGHEIVVPDVKVNYCKNSECEHSWLPSAEEERIDLYILQKSRKFLEPEHVKLIRESLGFSTKTAAANFLTLNSKAFTKWENGYTEPNPANDLLMRLAVFSEANFNFIKDLHAKKFVFDPLDYEMICKSDGQDWKYRPIHVNPISPEIAFKSDSLIKKSEALYPQASSTFNISLSSLINNSDYEKAA